jgi:hypothetical protein
MATNLRGADTPCGGAGSCPRSDEGNHRKKIARARLTRTGGLSQAAWVVGGLGLRAGVSGTLHAAPKVADARARCAGAGGHGELVGAVRALWLATHPGVLEAPEPRNARGS